MTRFRIRLLITLALFATVSVAGVVDASAAQRWSEDGPGAQAGTISDNRRPAIRPTTGEPDITGGTAPSKLGLRPATPPTTTTRDHANWRHVWVSRIWAAWNLSRLR